MTVQDIDVSLIQRAAHGDSEAFAALFDQYYAQVHRYALWLCGDADIAEDITQETFIRAHRNLDRLGPPYNVRAWLFRLAHNYFVDTTRQGGVEVPLDTDGRMPAATPTPEMQIAFRELSNTVSRALGRLPTSEREALVLREIEGFQYHEIAEVLGMSLDSIKVVLHRARGSFKDYYAVRVLAEDPLPKCDVLGDLLDSFEDGLTLPAKQDKLVREHIKACDTCQQRKREIAAIGVLLRGIPMPETPTKRLRGRVLKGTAYSEDRGQRSVRWIGLGGILLLVLLLGFAYMASTRELDQQFGGGNSRGLGGVTATPTGTDTPTPTSTATKSGIAPVGPSQMTAASTQATAGPDACTDRGGTQFQGTICVCPGVLDVVTICGDGTKFDNPTGESCTPSEDCSQQTCTCDYICTEYGGAGCNVGGYYDSCTGAACTP